MVSAEVFSVNFPYLSLPFVLFLFFLDLSLALDLALVRSLRCWEPISHRRPRFLPRLLLFCAHDPVRFGRVFASGSEYTYIPGFVLDLNPENLAEELDPHCPNPLPLLFPAEQMQRQRQLQAISLYLPDSSPTSDSMLCVMRIIL